MGQLIPYSWDMANTEIKLTERQQQVLWCTTSSRLEIRSIGRVMAKVYGEELSSQSLVNTLTSLRRRGLVIADTGPRMTYTQTAKGRTVLAQYELAGRS